MEEARPKVTVAVPLYRSSRFLAIVTETLRFFDYPNLEFIVSDRHLEDDAIERLRETFSGDGRFRFLPAEDSLDWVSHYNLLLREATGEYLIWVSHDDSYSAGFIGKLVTALEQNPGAVVAMGRAERIGIDGQPLTYVTPKIPAEPNHPGPLLAYRVAISGGLQFHGLFRRRVLVERELWIRPTVENIAADMLWIFTVALIGVAVYVDDCTFWKRYYPNSAHKNWGSIMQPRYVWNFASVACSYLDDYAPTWAQRLVGKGLTYLACGLWAVRLSKRSWARRFNTRARYTL